MKHTKKQDLIVFAHMMKTAGTSLNKLLIGHYGKKMHIVPGGLKLKDDFYEKGDLLRDIEKSNLSIIAGHPLRPYKDFDIGNLQWITFMRNPLTRYVSHYLYDDALSNHFSNMRFKDMKDDSIIEWEKIERNANYQTKFIAGEVNFDKAVEILETKMSWVGLTEEFENSLCSFKNEFNIKNFYYDAGVTNKSRSNVSKNQKVLEDFSEFIEEKNIVDLKLYAYVKENIWPKYKVKEMEACCNNNGKGEIHRLFNMVSFQINRQLKYRTTEINLKNIRLFYNRWYK